MRASSSARVHAHIHITPSTHMSVVIKEYTGPHWTSTLLQLSMQGKIGLAHKLKTELLRAEGSSTATASAPSTPSAGC